MSELLCRCGCNRPAVLLATGTDYDGTAFVDEPVCELAADYLSECAGGAHLPISFERVTVSCVSPSKEEER